MIMIYAKNKRWRLDAIISFIEQIKVAPTLRHQNTLLCRLMTSRLKTRFDAHLTTHLPPKHQARQVDRVFSAH